MLRRLTQFSRKSQESSHALSAAWFLAALCSTACSSGSSGYDPGPVATGGNVAYGGAATTTVAMSSGGTAVVVGGSSATTGGAVGRGGTESVGSATLSGGSNGTSTGGANAVGGVGGSSIGGSSVGVVEVGGNAATSIAGNGSTNGGTAASGGTSVLAGAAGSLAGTAGLPTRIVPTSRAPGFPDDSYQPKSRWILDATPNIDYVNQCARFWFKSRDEAGGYFTSVMQDGSVSTYYTGKSDMTQTRNAYGFVRAFMLTGDEVFLEHAEHALDYHYSLWLPGDGGWEVNHGSFAEHYGLLGPVTMCEATREAKHCDFAAKAEANLDAHLWDPDPSHDGYYESGSLGWTTPSGKGFTATVDAITTHEWLRWLANPTARATRLHRLGSNMLEHLIGNLQIGTSSFGFPENFSTDWQSGGVGTFDCFTGHVLKTSWMLSRLYLAFSEEPMRSGAEVAIDEVLTKVWDENLAYRFTSRGGPPEWWELEEAFNAGMLGYYTGRNAELRARHLKLADAAIEAFHTVYDDPIYGETFKLPNTTTGYKGDYYKAGYHTTETGYYSLLYGQLLYQHLPVTLHYRFQPATEARQIELTPLLARNLVITAVALDGKPFENYDAQTRMLSIPPATGGVFKVTFWANDG